LSCDCHSLVHLLQIDLHLVVDVIVVLLNRCLIERHKVGGADSRLVHYLATLLVRFQRLLIVLFVVIEVNVVSDCLIGKHQVSRVLALPTTIGVSRLSGTQLGI